MFLFVRAYSHTSRTLNHGDARSAAVIFENIVITTTYEA